MSDCAYLLLNYKCMANKLLYGKITPNKLIIRCASHTSSHIMFINFITMVQSEHQV